MEKQIEKQMGNETETRVFIGMYRDPNKPNVGHSYRLQGPGLGTNSM